MLNLFGRSIVSVDDLTNYEIEQIFEQADLISESREHFFGALTGRVMATLFYEPSTRTRLSFESAMQRLGGGVISSADMSNSSAAKGETLSDTIRVVGKYADVIVLRHPSEGAGKLASEMAGIPVLNAGDGGHEHPTQTLCDLYTLRKKHGHLGGLRIAICGDLKYGRTVHSLIYALARFGASVILLPGTNRDLPENLQRKLERDYGVSLARAKLGSLGVLYGGEDSDEPPDNAVDAIYMTPSQSQSHQLSLLTDEGMDIEFNGVHLYVTRAQKERWTEAERESSRYPKVTSKVLSHPVFKTTSILHPLPRVDEISREIDDDPRSLYFEQAANGVPIRMALLLAVLNPQMRTEEAPEATSRYILHSSTLGSKCDNEHCITRSATEQVLNKSYLIPDYDGYRMRCYYCDSDLLATVYGNTFSKVFHSIKDLRREAPLPEHVVFFRNEPEAISAGFRPVSPNTRRAPKQESSWPPLLRKARARARTESLIETR